MIKRELGAENKGKLPHLFIPSETATLVPEFAEEDLPLGKTAAMVPEFAVKDLPLGRRLWCYIYIYIRIYMYHHHRFLWLCMMDAVV